MPSYIRVGEQEFVLLLYGGGDVWRPCILVGVRTDDLLVVQFWDTRTVHVVLLIFCKFYDFSLDGVEVRYPTAVLSS